MIAIIGALDAEVNALRDIMEHYEISNHSGIEFTIGTLAGKEIVLMKSGVGKGYAAMSCAILLERFTCDAIINIGTAGGLKQEQQVLDVVISSSVVQHDFDTSILDGLSGIGMYFDADERLVSLCQKELSGHDYGVWIGQVASGDLFVAGEQRLNRLIQTFPNAHCAEMEAGAIAQVASHYQVPFVVIRSLSDVAWQKDSQMDFPTYLKKASVRSAQFTKAIVAKL